MLYIAEISALGLSVKGWIHSSFFPPFRITRRKYFHLRWIIYYSWDCFSSSHKESEFPKWHFYVSSFYKPFFGASRFSPCLCISLRSQIFVLHSGADSGASVFSQPAFLSYSFISTPSVLNMISVKCGKNDSFWNLSHVSSFIDASICLLYFRAGTVIFQFHFLFTLDYSYK